MDTEILKIDDAVLDAAKIGYAASLVEQGKLVVFPTETVYGIAAMVDSGTFARLDEIKSRDAVKHYSLHIGNPGQLKKFVPQMGLRTKKLADNCFPGPVTIVFDIGPDQIEILEQKYGREIVSLLYKNNSLGVRCPDNPVSSAFLSLIDAPVVATSANLGGQTPAIDAESALQQLNGNVDAVIDAGPCSEKINSTVVRIADKGIEILRQGGVTREEILQKATVNIVFVCSGNTCRSPIAQAVCEKLLAEKLNCNIDQLEQFGYKVTSAGVMAYIDQPASRYAQQICADMGLDLSSHRSDGLSESLIQDSDIIYVMSSAHKNRILEFYPEVEEKCLLLSSDQDISDPFGGDMSDYKKCALDIVRALNHRLGVLSL